MSNPGPAVDSTGSLVSPISNVTEAVVLAVALTPVAVATVTTAEQIFDVPGVLASDFISVNPAAATAGVGIVGARASADGQIGITYVNPTAGSLTPAAGTYLIKVEHLMGQAALASAPY